MTDPGGIFWGFLAALVVALLLWGGVPTTLAQTQPDPDPEPAPLYGTEPMDFGTPWEFLLWLMPGGLTGAMALHYVSIVLAADKIVPGWSGSVEDDS